MNLSESTISAAIDALVAVLGAANGAAAREIGTRRVSFTALTAPILTALLTESANGVTSYQWKTAMAEMQDAIDGFSFEVQAIQTSQERAIAVAILRAAANVAVLFVTSAVGKIGLAAALALIA
jgi:hypothetical protein